MLDVSRHTARTGKGEKSEVVGSRTERSEGGKTEEEGGVFLLRQNILGNEGSFFQVVL